MSIFVGPSIWREVNPLAMARTWTAISSSPQAEKIIWAPIWNDALLGRSRSLMMTEALKTDADVMVILDGDIVFEPRDFWKIVEGARETRSIYGGAYVSRSTKPFVTSRLLPNSQVAWGDGPIRRPLEIQYLSTGFWAMHRSVLERMTGSDFEDAYGTHRLEEVVLGADRPFIPYFSPFVCREDDGRLHYLSEDWACCNRARQLGFTIWMDQSIILQHFGEYPYTVFDIEQGGWAFVQEQQQQGQIDRSDFESQPFTTGLELVDSLAADIAEWADESIGDVHRMMAQGPEDTSRLFRERPAGESESDWYRREDVGLAYMCELAGWHMLGGGAWGLAAGAVSGRRILDFGCGIATWSLVAASRGAEAYCYEPNPTMREFAEWRARKHGLRLTFLEQSPVSYAHAAEPYDDVVAWHVFEHLEQPEVALDSLLRALRPGGRLLTESGFDDHLPAQHHEHPDWAGALARAGLVEVSPAVYVAGAEEDGATGNAGSASAAPSSTAATVGAA